MQKYSNNLIEMFYNSSYAGAMSGADVIVKNENETNGEVVKTYLVVRDGVLKDCSFQAMGSISLYASLTTMCALSKGRPLSEILNITEKDIINELKQLNKQEYGEVVFALDSFKKSVLTYMKRKNSGTISEKPSQKLRNIAPARNITRFGDGESKISQIESAMQQPEEKDAREVVLETKPVAVVAKQENKDGKTSAKKEVKETNTKIKVNKKPAEGADLKEVKKETSINKNEKKLDALISEVKLETARPQSITAKEQDSELLIIPVGGRKKAKKMEKPNIVIPTKIEVRVVEEENKKSPSKKEKVEKGSKSKLVQKENPYLIKPELKDSADEEVIDEIDSITEQLTNAISQLNFKFDDEEK